MTLEERCKKFINESRRYKRKYLTLRFTVDKIFKDIVKSSYDVNGNTVVDINDVMMIIDKYTKGEQ